MRVKISFFTNSTLEEREQLARVTKLAAGGKTIEYQDCSSICNFDSIVIIVEGSGLAEHHSAALLRRVRDTVKQHLKKHSETQVIVRDNDWKICADERAAA